MHWTLRLGAALCFIGHGAFGVITKAAWLPYFGVVGISEAWAWRLMPLVGVVDISAGLIVLLSPRRIVLLYMVFWATWTALLRPLAGEPLYETLERAGNYGVPLALLLMAGVSRPLHWRSLLGPVREWRTDADTMAAVRSTLQWTTALLLFGHGGLGVINKALLAAHYASVGLPESLTPIVGWLEIALAVAVVVRPSVSLLLLAMGWKLASEALFITAGAPVWEFIERAGSYAAPLALALLMLLPKPLAAGRIAPA